MSLILQLNNEFSCKHTTYIFYLAPIILASQTNIRRYINVDPVYFNEFPQQRVGYHLVVVNCHDFKSEGCRSVPVTCVSCLLYSLAKSIPTERGHQTNVNKIKTSFIKRKLITNLKEWIQFGSVDPEMLTSLDDMGN